MNWPTNENPFKDHYGLIQWKGTDVCMDIQCSCGESTHVDGDFAYVIQCCACNKFWMPNPHVKLHKIQESDIETLKTTRPLKSEFGDDDPRSNNYVPLKKPK